MTPEEIQRAIEGMLAVQKGLQDSQLSFSWSLDRLREDIAELRILDWELAGFLQFRKNRQKHCNTLASNKGANK